MSAASTRPRRRRRRRDSSPLRRSPEQLNQLVPYRRVRAADALGAAAICVICAALIGLIWLNATNAITERAEGQRARVEAVLTAQATTLAMQAEHELQQIDQSLAIIQAAWDEDPSVFRLNDWRNRLPALTAVADDIFIANQDAVIVQDLLPAAIGQGLGSAYLNIASGSLQPIRFNDPAVRDSRLLIGELGSDAVTRAYTMFLVRPLQAPKGWFVGAAYRSNALARVFTVAGLGQGGLGALVDTVHGDVQALAGSAAIRPERYIGKSALYQAMKTHPDSGLWIGATPIDQVTRIIAYHRVPGRQLVVLVGESDSIAMEPADSWSTAVRSLAVMASLLVIGIGAAIWWELWHWRQIRRRQRALAHTQTLLTGTQTELAALRRRSAVDEMQVQALLPLATAGVAVTDPQDRLARWNPRFIEMLGVPPDSLREGLPLDELLRRQVAQEPTVQPEALEAEVARRLALLHPEAAEGSLAWTASDGSALVMQATTLPDRGALLIVQHAAEEASEEDAAADPVEW